MRTIMRNAVLAAAALMCFSGPARAAETTMLEAKVPFDFVVNGQPFPAGTYLIQRDDVSASILLIRGEGRNHATAFVSTIPDGGHDPAGSQPVLTFKRLENRYRLTSVWQSADRGWDVRS